MTMLYFYDQFRDSNLHSKTFVAHWTFCSRYICVALVIHIHRRQTMPRATIKQRWRVIALHDMCIRDPAAWHEKIDCVQYSETSRSKASWRQWPTNEWAPKNASIYVLLWPNKSPDLKFIENISAHITRQINRMNLMPINAADLRRALHTEWRRLTLTRIRRPIAGIHRRLRAIVAAQGGHTRC